LPAEGNRAGPRALVAAPLPRAVLALPDGPAQRATALGTTDLATQRRVVDSPARQLRQAERAKRATGQQDREGFEEIRLALGVGPGEDVELRRRAVGEGAIITEFE